MEENTPVSDGFVQRRLPWLLAAVFLVLYLVTLNRWVGASNLDVLAQLTERDGDLLFTKPLLYVVTLPLRAVPAALLPVAANAGSALLAALTIGVLARCVSLLPHDRTREQRLRGHVDGSPLNIRLAWVPPVFAAALLGLQLTFWEQATSLTGEMLDLLVIATVILCLLEYRRGVEERWLWAFTFIYGLGTANNWAMIAYFPLFLTALIWIRGFSFFNAGFLLRLTGWGLAGLLLYLLMPVIASLKYGADLPVWAGFKAMLATQRDYLLGIPRGRTLLLAPVALAPLALIGVRWGGLKGTSMETMLNIAAVVVLQVLWLAGNIFFAFDPVFSPRQLVHLDPAAGGLPLLTFYFAGALACGYFVGYFLLLGTAKPVKSWERPSGAVAGLIKLAFGGVLLAAVAVPAGLAFKNLPAVREQNGPILRDTAAALASALPPEASLVLADDRATYGLVAALLDQTPDAPKHLLFYVTRGVQATYRRAMAARHGEAWPEIRQLAEVRENVAAPFLFMLARAATNNRAFYLHPSFNFPAESTWASPAGGVFALRLFTPKQVTPPPLPPQSLDAAVQWWTANQPLLDRVTAAVANGTANGRLAGMIWSRSVNGVGVMLQQGGRLEEAARFFALALKLNPKNASATVNLAVNESLKGGRTPDPEVSKPLLGRRPLDVLGDGGPVDEPVFLDALGQTVLQTQDGLVRRAAIAFERAYTLSPGLTSARLGFVEACLAAQQHELALQRSRELKQSPLEPLESAQVAYLEGSALFALGRGEEAEQILKAAVAQHPEVLPLTDLLTYYYLAQNRFDDAAPLLRNWQRLRPNDSAPLLRLAVLHMNRQQYAEALPFLENALKLEPENAPALANRAICYLQVNRLDDAKREYERLADKFPDQHIFHYGLGDLADRRKAAGEALRHFERYLELAPTNTLEYSNVVVRVTQLKRNP